MTLLSVTEGWCFLNDIQIPCVLLTLLAFAGSIYVGSFPITCYEGVMIGQAFPLVITIVKLVSPSGPD